MMKHLLVILALSGMVASALALREHYRTDTSPCSINDKWDCGIVNHSPYATLGGVPVALVGSVGYALLAAFAGRLPRTTALMALIGLLFSLRLTWIEWKKLGVWCIYCVTSQGIIATLFVIAILS